MRAKSLAAVGDGAGQDRRFERKVAIVVGANPCADDVAAGLPVQLFRDGGVFAGALRPTLMRLPDGTLRGVRLTTDETGRATVPAASGAMALANAVAHDEEKDEARSHSR